MIATLTAQTGPGGVGDTNNIILWLDASTLNLNDGDPVSTWSDISTKNNDAVQLNPSNQAHLKVDGIKKSVQFDGTNDFYDFTHNITTSGLTAFIVTKRDASLNTQSAIISLSKHYVYTQSSTIRGLYANLINHTIPFPNDIFSQFSIQTGSNSTSDDLNITSTLSSKNFTRGPFFNNTHSTLGALKSQNGLGSYLKFFNGEIAEVILFNNTLNTAEVNIISEFLSIKHGIVPFKNIYSYKSSHFSNFIGIGQESDGSTTSASDNEKITISNPTHLDNGEYLVVANDNLGYVASTNVPVGYSARWEQTWRVGEIGELGGVNLTVEFDGDGLLSSGNHVLLIDDDGDFTNGGSRYVSGNNVAFPPGVQFLNINLNDGEYFTIAKRFANIESQADGNWNNTSSWNCACVPTESDNIKIDHDILVDGNSSALNIDISSNGSIDFNGNDTLFVHGNLYIDGTINNNSGTFASVGSNMQDFRNNNSNSITKFNNLFVNNSNGLYLTNGGFGISNNLQVSLGFLTNDGADSVVLFSDTFKSSQILPSVDNAFSGEFIIQRFISARSTGYANISSPIENATFNDLDDDLYISGAGGLDGNATVNGGGTFYSLRFFDSFSDSYQNLTNINASMVPGSGYVLYLASTLQQFNGSTVDYIGTPNSGNVKVKYQSQINRGWNLLGNPYHAHIDYDKSRIGYPIPESYYVYDTDNGTYDFQTGTSKRPIAPGQAFWLSTNNGGGYYLEFEESDKVDNNSSVFFRKKNDSYFNLNISNQQNPFKHKMRLAFDVFATEEMDEKDALHLPSPIKEAPAIYSKAVNSEEELIMNSLNPTEESQLVPVSIYAGVEGEYEISAGNLDALYDNYSCVYLKDKETEKAVDLMVDPKYSFEAKQGKSDRFHLILSNSYEECQALLKEGEFVQDFDKKLSLRNAYENWYVDYTLGKEITQLEIRVYNMSGQEVKASMSFEAHSAGTYPLQHLNDLEGIYLIQIVGKDIFLNKQVKL